MSETEIQAENVTVQGVTTEATVPEVDTSFKFTDKTLVAMEAANVMAVTTLNNLNPEYLKACKKQQFEDLVLEKECYKDRAQMELGGYPQEYVDRAIKTLKAFYGLKKKDSLFVHTRADMPIIITGDYGEVDEKVMAIVLAPRVTTN